MGKSYHHLPCSKNRFFSKNALGNVLVRVVLYSHTYLLRETEDKQSVINKQHPEIKRYEKKENLPQTGFWERGGMAVPISYDPNDLKLGG